MLVWALASGFKQTPHSFEAAVLMTRWMFPYIGFMSMVALSAGVLNTWKRFAVPASTPVLLNLSMIAAAWLGAPWFASHGHRADLRHGAGRDGGRRAAACGADPRVAPARAAAAHRPGLVRGCAQAWTTRARGRSRGMMAPALLGVGVAQISLLINTQIASWLAPAA